MAPGTFVFWGLFVAVGVITVAYVIWLIWSEK